MSDDTITVVENYCMACQGECTNKDPDDFDHLLMEWDQLTGAWMDRGSSPASLWAFMASVLLSIARENDLGWEEVQTALKAAWEKGERQ